MAKTRHILIALTLLALTTSAFSAEKTMVQRGITIALPKDSAVKVRWVCPPIDGKTVDEAKWYDVDFAVDSSGCPWIGRDRCILMSPTKQYQYSVDQYFDDIVFLDSGALILNSKTHIGSPVLPKDKTFDYRDLPQADFQPIAEMPVPACRIFAGSGDCLYLVGRDPATTTNGIYLLRPEKGALGRFSRLFASQEQITAVTGDGERTYIATDRLILKVLANGTVSKVYTHPSQWITGLAYDPQIGLFYATEAGVGFIGSGGSTDLLAATKPQICLKQGTLYVFLPKTYGVLALDNIKDIKRFNLAIRDVPATKSDEVKVTGVRFFESGPEPPEPQDRAFGSKFERAATRYVCCQVEMDNLLYEKRAHKHTVTMEFVAPGEEWGEPVKWQVDFQPDAPNMWSWARIGADWPGSLYPGEYRVRVYLDGSRIDERKFTVEGDATPIEAAWHKDMSRLKALLARGADPNEAGAEDMTPLMVAAWTGSIENMKLLLARKADTNARDSAGNTALHHVIGHEKALEMAQLLLAHGADPDITDNQGNTVLYEAGLFCMPEMTRLLLEHGADPNARNKDGNSVLHNIGLQYSNPILAPETKALEMLLKAGADPNLKSQFGEPLLFDCCESGNIEAARLLLKYGADVNAIRKGTDGGYDTSVLGHALMEYGWQKDPGVRDRQRALIRLLSASGAQLLPGEMYMVFRDGADSLLDRGIIRDCLEKDNRFVFSYAPEDPGLRALVLERLMRIAFSSIASAKSSEDLSKVLNLCLDARTKADLWGMLPKCPDISFNCGLLWVRTGNPSNARMYLEEYLRLAPNGSAASKAKELLGQ